MSHAPSKWQPMPSLLDYCTDFEWPESEEQTIRSTSVHLHPFSTLDSQPTRAVPLNSVFLRMSVLSSTVLSHRAVALIDSFDEVSIGRDRCSTPRLRLKELAVSKYHASIYWDSQTKLWSLVDLGSTHGTHLIPPDSPVAQASGSVSSEGYTQSPATRLSPPKSASLPRALSHLQHIVIGSTTLVVHMHADRNPCDACTVAGHTLIDLNPSISKPSKEPSVTSTKSLKALKRNLLSRPSYAIPAHERGYPPETYVDRAELRRQRYPGWRDPKASNHNESTSTLVKGTVRPNVKDQDSGLETAAPISLDNIGHRLLTKKGWVPGLVLGPQSETGIMRVALSEPIVPRATTNRRGLGMHGRQ